MTGRYRGYDIITSPPPSSGGIGILQMLGVLEGNGIREGRRRIGHRGALYGGSHAALFRRPLAKPGRPRFREGSAERRCSTRKYILKLRSSIDPEKATPSSAGQGRRYLTGTNPTRPRTSPSPTTQGNVVAGDLHAERRLRQQGDGHRTGIPAEQRDGRFRGQAGHGQHVRADPGRSQRHRAAQDAALFDDADHRAARTASRSWRWARRAGRPSSTPCWK